jgi:hypothetical protein
MKEVIKSGKYKDARKKIDSLKERLTRADEGAALQVDKEAREFFSALRKSDPELCAVFKADETYLGMEIIRLLTGEDVIID